MEHGTEGSLGYRARTRTEPAHELTKGCHSAKMLLLSPVSSEDVLRTHGLQNIPRFCHVLCRERSWHRRRVMGYRAVCSRVLVCVHCISLGALGEITALLTLKAKLPGPGFPYKCCWHMRKT